MWALVVSAVVVELTSIDPAGRFHASLVWVACGSVSGIAVGWTYDGTNFAAPPTPPAPTLAQQAAAMLVAGCAIVSTGTSALNGTYAVDQQSQINVQAEVISLLLNSAFTNGTTSINWPDVADAMHTFDVAHFKALATALGMFVGTLKPIVATNTGALPAQPAVIA